MPTGVCPQHTNNNGEVRVGKMNFHTLLPLDIALQVEHQEFIIVLLRQQEKMTVGGIP